MQSIFSSITSEESFLQIQTQKTVVYIVINDDKIHSHMLKSLKRKYTHSDFIIVQTVYDALYKLVQTKIESKIFFLASNESQYEISSYFPKIKDYLVNKGIEFSSNLSTLKLFLTKSKKISEFSYKSFY